MCVIEVEFQVVLGRHFLGKASGWGHAVHFAFFILKPIYNLQTQVRVKLDFQLVTNLKEMIVLISSLDSEMCR